VLSIRTFYRIVFLFVFIFLINLTRVYAEEKFFSLLTSQDRLKEDTVEVKGQDVENIRKFEPGLGAVGTLKLGLGHHDNFAKDTSSGGQKLETSDAFWTFYGEFGIRFKSLSALVGGSLVAPLPRTNDINGYTHQGELDDKVLLLRWRMLNWTSRINFFPTIGYRWLSEDAKIYDKSGTNPDILNLNHKDRGPFYGADLHYSIAKRGHKDDRVISSYTFENLKNYANKYKIAWAWIKFLTRKEDAGRRLTNLQQVISFAVEYITWKDGRKDWFLTASIGGSIDF